jgi:hypothetical protein
MSETGEQTELAGGAAHIHALIASLDNESPAAREAARASLIALGQAVVPALSSAAASNPTIRREAVKALGQIADPSGTPALVRALEDEDGGVRWLAAEGLLALGKGGLEPRRLEPLLVALVARADSAWLREGAHHVLRTWAGPFAPIVHALEGPAPAVAVPVATEEVLRALDRGTSSRPRDRFHRNFDLT